MKYLSPSDASRYLQEKFGLRLESKVPRQPTMPRLGTTVRPRRSTLASIPARDLDVFAELPEPDKEWRPQEVSAAAADERARRPGARAAS